MGILSAAKLGKYEKIKKNSHKEALKATLSKLKKEKNPIYDEVKEECFSYLGEGTYAVAYKLGKYCFKVTGDDDDAIMSYKTKQTNLKHIVYTYEVYKTHSYFVIITDFLEDFPKRGKYRIFYKYASEVATIMRKYFRYRNLTAEETIIELKEQITLSNKVVEEIMDLCETLITYNFKNIDIHSDNIKLGRDGYFKVIDLGHYTSDTPIEIEEI